MNSCKLHELIVILFFSPVKTREMSTSKNLIFRTLKIFKAICFKRQIFPLFVFFINVTVHTHVTSSSASNFKVWSPNLSIFYSLILALLLDFNASSYQTVYLTLSYSILLSNKLHYYFVKIEKVIKSDARIKYSYLKSLKRSGKKKPALKKKWKENIDFQV